MTLRFASGVSTAETDYGTVLLDERSGDYWELNPTGTLVVKTLLGGGDEAAAIATLESEFDIGAAQARQDVETLVRQLREAGLAE
ncbi:lasso peptide biosynthesis PqqD family chaperone [Streptomyces sp. JJ38]|uniref:lasso peptide biosynthesis PqqD family chaperone n=1 Tax=Streptomyces sp. JJ38 TaxID=2738128 RepID=UPI001C598D49|nr:lasso peptide biosynthesis PqqD family chaperone [Streptomyces sp. JJ38]MBW1599502.1 lasso peptide biosynthesis PqqD family chaperone [Streptomyces sp. JJ38]